MKILVAEDDSVSRLLLATILRNWGHEVVETVDGNQALRVFAGEDSPLLVILDVMMPEIDGFEVCRRLRRMPLAVQPYIIFLTAKQDKADVMTGIEAGANDYLTKPLDREELFVRVKVGVSTCTHLLERKLAETALREREKQFESIVGSLDEAVWSIAPDGSTAYYVSPAGIKIYKRQPAEFYRNPRLWFELVHPEDKLLAREFAAKIRAEGHAQVEYRFLRGDNEVGWVYSRAALFCDDYKKPLRIDGITVDITARKQLEEQLRQAQKLEAVGQLAAGIAHEINTPLQYVGDNTIFLQTAFRDLTALVEKQQELVRACENGAANAELFAAVARARDESDAEFLLGEIPAAFEQSLEGLDRVTRIVQSIKEFAHPGSTEMVCADLNRHVQSAITMARNEWKYVADVATEFDDSLPPLKCAIGEITQVILNLIVNAAHAIAEKNDANANAKGLITIRTRRKSACCEHCESRQNSGEKPAQAWAEISISDTGSGIAAHLRDKVFDLFFTTKPVGKGTGQGLAIAHRIVTKHNGTINFVSEPGRGTTFTVQLPIDS